MKSLLKKNKAKENIRIGMLINYLHDVEIDFYNRNSLNDSRFMMGLCASVFFFYFNWFFGIQVQKVEYQRHIHKQHS